MRNQPVEFFEPVEGDLRYACDYYESWQIGGSERFQDRFRDTVSWISWNPEMFPRKYRFFRRVIVRRSYFGVVFAIEPEVTTVVAVLDLRQNPHEMRRILEVRAHPNG